MKSKSLKEHESNHIHIGKIRVYAFFATLVTGSILYLFTESAYNLYETYPHDIYVMTAVIILWILIVLLTFLVAASIVVFFAGDYKVK